MSQENYTAPEFRKDAFHCPICNVYAHQKWYATGLPASFAPHTAISHLIPESTVAHCSRCKQFSFWVKEKLIYPSTITAPLPHKDMPKPVLEYYNEAREVSVSSNRAAAALLRLAAKKLCEELGENEPNLNRAIGKLSEKGLPQSAIKSLDAVRIVGNEGGAHEGQIDLSGEDNKEIVNTLFKLVNFIVEKTISDPKEIEDIFGSLPEDKKQGVQNRDTDK